MNEHPEAFGPDEPMDDEIRNLPDVPADPEFRARLRETFVQGAVREAPKPAAHPIHRWRWIAMPLAACLLIVAVVIMNRGPKITIASTSWDGKVVVNGDSIPVVERARLANALTPGSRITVPGDAGLDISMDDVMVYEIAGGTQMTIPGSPGRWFGRSVACSVYVGEMRIMTGKAFAGSELRAYTPDGIVEITGTMVSIQCDENGTCVCVLEGVAHVGTGESDMEPVKPGFRKVMPRGGTPEIVPIKPMHRDGVLDFESRMKGKIDR